MARALERAANPAVLRLHTTAEVTRKTIKTCPPASAPPPLRWLLGTQLFADLPAADLGTFLATVDRVVGGLRNATSA